MSRNSPLRESGDVIDMELKTFKLHEIVTLNGQQYKIVRIWKSGKARLNMVKHPNMYTILSLHYMREHCEY